MLVKTQGIIIKRSDLGKFDRLLTIYTKDFGKLLVKAKSVRKPESKLKGHLELFLHIHLMFALGKNGAIVTQAQTLNSFSCLKEDLKKIGTAYYLADLIDKLIAGPEKDLRIWSLILESFLSIEKSQSQAELEKIVHCFENRFLEFLGYGQADKFKKNQNDSVINFIQGLINQKIYSYNFWQRVVSFSSCHSRTSGNP